MDYIPLRSHSKMDLEHGKDFPSRVSRTPTVRRHMWSLPEKVYLGTTLAEAVIIMGVALGAFVIVQVWVTVANKHTITVSVYMSIFILSRLFSCAYALDALRARNVVQLALHICFEVVMLVYAILEIPQVRIALRTINDPVACKLPPGGGYDCIGPGTLYSLLQKLLIVPPIIIGLSIVLYCMVAKKLYEEFGWAVFRMVQASIEMKRMHRQYQTLVSLLKLVAFFASAFCMAYIVLVSSLWKVRTEFIITVVALPVFYPTLLATGWALRHESMLLMAVCIFLLIAGEAYFIYKMASLWLQRTAWLYKNTRITIAVFSGFAILLLAVTIVYACICAANFGKGLKNAHDNPENKTSIFTVPGMKRSQKDAPEYEERLVIE